VCTEDREYDVLQFHGVRQYKLASSFHDTCFLEASFADGGKQLQEHMVSTLTRAVSDSLRHKLDSCKGFALELDGGCDAEKIYSVELVGSLEDGCIDAEVIKACCVYLRTYCPLFPPGAKLSLCDGDEVEEAEGEDEVQISTAAFTPMLMNFGRYVVAFETLATTEQTDRDWREMIQHVVPLFTSWADASREVAEVHAIAS
jgi:hypothetical protein